MDFMYFVALLLCSSLDAMLNGSSQGSVCGSWSLLMAAFRVSAAHYLVVYHTDSVGVYG